jgi:multiple sugar transport system ATP-binding protein
MVFQNYALYPHMTVADNMAFALKMAKVPTEERQRRVAEAAKILGLTDYLERKPKALSGGQRQRVAVARALSNEPSVVLADEPTGNLDTRTGAEVVELLTGLAARHGTTVVVATHDATLAARAPRRLGMRDGRLLTADEAVAFDA